MPQTREELLAQNDTLKELTTYALDGWVQVRREIGALEARADILHDNQRRTVTVVGQSVGEVLRKLLEEIVRLQDLADEERETYRAAQVDRLCGVRP